ncbi:MAG TPA: hypothetical protein DCX32_04645 [Candidatus Moranbacteria bacterium]|nr:MAG: hypothetical protein UW87_C0001G0020 [Candidatus Moranbacteria bacterium GW2011_GWC2_45_10]KKT94948.1 MAG: hypothetical protein UW95_C0006G0013 [Parcubacteria group bacterium GW2011_GWC1_45_14]HAV11797.1 hypothetical protein [Candidatus Moranbacteria bacterium]
MNNPYEEKNIPKKRRFWTRVSVVGVIFTVTALFILADAFKEYKSTVTILVAVKSETLSRQAGPVVENIAEFPRTLSFYERLLKFNPDVKDGFVGKNPRERKKLWNRQVEVSSGKSDQGTIVTLSVFGKTPVQAELLSRKTSDTLFNVVGNFYNIKTDLNISIIDGPLVSASWRNWFFTALLSLLSGFAASLLLNYSLEFLEKPSGPASRRRAAISASRGGPKRPSFKKSPLADLKQRFAKKTEEKESPASKQEEGLPQDIPYHFEEEAMGGDVPAAPYFDLGEHEKEEVASFDKGDYPNFPEIPKGPARSASAPANLPIAEEFFPFEEPGKKMEKNEEKLEEPQSFVEMKKEEPSEEELRERLNKLLKGDM